jgi:multicomponent Na+:H+ antiporter subunit G
VTLAELLGALLVAGGVAFFIAGSIGLLRLPDVYTRLHALTKADNLGLGLLCAGLALIASDWRVALKLLLIWQLVMFSGASASHLIAAHMSRRGTRPWRAP